MKSLSLTDFKNCCQRKIHWLLGKLGPCKIFSFESIILRSLVIHRIFKTDCCYASQFSSDQCKAIVIPKVKWINSWLRILCCNSLTHFKLKVVDIMTFQTKLCTKSFIFFPKKLFYPIKTMFRLYNEFLFYLEKWIFSNHSHPGTKSDFFWLDVIISRNDFWPPSSKKIYFKA